MTLPSRITGQLVAGAIAATLIVYVFGRISALQDAEGALITQASQAQLGLHRGLVRWRDKLHKIEREKWRLASRLAAVGDSLTRLAERADSADSAQAVAAGQPVPAPSPWRAVADSNRAAYQGCSLAYRSCEQRASSAEAEADSLAQRLEDQLTVKPKRCWIALGGGVAVGQGYAWGATFGASCGLLRIPLLP